MKKSTELNVLVGSFVLFSILLPVIYFQISQEVFDLVVIILEVIYTLFAIVTFYFSKKLVDVESRAIRKQLKTVAIRAVITIFYVLNILITFLLAAFGT